ncbi:hypothetical protein ACFCX4_25245 [Kitasatospora sp. NPDC056327]|uniref:hypothetical protein n=1 Tax=Kitasatospora sp. NPDC056327 TaxID=3345785 RepID=UPI0035D9B2A2
MTTSQVPSSPPADKKAAAVGAEPCRTYLRIADAIETAISGDPYVLLDAGENVKALSKYLGHSDPGFTLRVYTHLMPSSDGRTRRAVDRLYETLGWAAGPRPDGPQAAQGD